MASNPLDIVRSRLPNPYRELAQIQSSFDRVFQDLLGPRAGAMQAFELAPSCEVMDEENQIVAKFDMPGISKEDIKIHLDGSQLTVTAERKEEKEAGTKKNRYSEITYGSYVRSFTLPSSIDEKKVDAKLNNGVLTVTLPKAASAKAKQIEVH